MKKGLSTLFFLFILLTIQASNPTFITGSWNRGTEKQLNLYKVISGRLTSIATYQLGDDGKFYFAFEPQEEGFYTIGTGSSQAAVNKYSFYFKPGDRLDFTVNDSTYVLEGKNTPENEVLTKWHDFAYPLEIRSLYFSSKYGRTNGLPSTYIDFFPLLEEYSEKVNTISASTGNKKFDVAFEKYKDCELVRYASTFLMTPRTAHPENEDFPDFYKKIDIAKFTATTDVYKYPFSVNMLENIVYIKKRLSQPSGTGIPDFSKMTSEEQRKYKSDEQAKAISMVKNDTLKGEFVLAFANRLKTYDEYTAFNKMYGQYILTQDQKDRENNILSKIAQNKSITETIDFSGTDVNDKTVSLSDFKGKVVVVDVWATWCGPCRKEIPTLKTITNEYQGKDVVFLSISLDDLKTKQKWVDFVKAEGLTGVQLFGGNGMTSDVAKFYKINAIPRFMVFGKDGKIVTDDSPRPSNPELKNMIEAQLKK